MRKLALTACDYVKAHTAYMNIIWFISYGFHDVK